MKPVLICRPQPGADATAERAREMGLAPLLYPLFAVEPLAWNPPEPARFDALMVTSANALRHGGDSLGLYRHLPLFAVGAATARAAKERGFTHVIEGRQNAQSLVGDMHGKGHENVLHLSGEHVRPYEQGGLAISRIAVYRSIEVGDAAGLADRLERAPVILVHSPRAGARLTALTPSARRASLAIAAISPAALEACGGGWAESAASIEPTDRQVLALAWRICQL